MIHCVSLPIPDFKGISLRLIEVKNLCLANKQSNGLINRFWSSNILQLLNKIPWPNPIDESCQLNEWCFGNAHPKSEISLITWQLNAPVTPLTSTGNLNNLGSSILLKAPDYLTWFLMQLLVRKTLLNLITFSVGSWLLCVTCSWRSSLCSRVCCRWRWRIFRSSPSPLESSLQNHSSPSCGPPRTGNQSCTEFHREPHLKKFNKRNYR